MPIRSRRVPNGSPDLVVHPDVVPQRNVIEVDVDLVHHPNEVAAPVVLELRDTVNAKTSVLSGWPSKTGSMEGWGSGGS